MKDTILTNFGSKYKDPNPKQKCLNPNPTKMSSDPQHCLSNKKPNNILTFEVQNLDRFRIQSKRSGSYWIRMWIRNITNFSFKHAVLELVLIFSVHLYTRMYLYRYAKYLPYTLFTNKQYQYHLLTAARVPVLYVI
jgi:hypothetical protein